MGYCKGVPDYIKGEYNSVIITGECVTDNEVENFRNYVSGALGLKEAKEFDSRNIRFIAHDSLGTELDYTVRMGLIEKMGFSTIFDKNLCGQYPQDGVVYRIDNWKRCNQLGYTSKSIFENLLLIIFSYPDIQIIAALSVQYFISG